MAPPDDLVAFCRREHPRLVGALTIYVGDRATAEELAHDALVTACARWPQVRRMAAPGAWVHRVAFNAARSRWRRAAAERRAMDRLTVRSAPAVTDQPDVATAITVRGALDALPARQAEALILRFYSDLPIEQAARAMGVTSAAVKSLTRRGLATLRSQLAGPPSQNDQSKETGHATS